MTPSVISGVMTRRRRKRVPTDNSLNKENNCNHVVDEVIEDVNATLIDLKICNIDNNNEFFVASRSCTSSSFWRKQSSSYIDIILRCSRGRTLPIGAVGTPHPLQDSYNALLNACRQNVKAATEYNNFGGNLLGELLVAAHGLRALSTIEVDPIITPIKLIYHALVTLSDRIQNTVIDHLDLSKAVSMSLAMYETLGSLLSTSRPDNFEPSKALFAFPNPISNVMSADLRQLLKIGIQSTLAVCNLLLKHTKSFPTAEFGSGVAKIMSKNDTAKVISGLVLEVVVPWTREHARNQESHKECIIFTKAAHRLLWDVAATQTSRDDALEMRQKAIQALILCIDGEVEDDLCYMISSTCSELACVYAWKASATYIQQEKCLVTDESKHAILFRFHDSVGNVLDRIAQLGCMSYLEYCSYRSLHVGSLKIKRSCSHILYDFPVQSNSTPPFQTLGEATLGIIFVVTSLQRELSDTSPLDSPRYYDSVLHLEQVCVSVVDGFHAVVSIPQSSVDLRRCYKLLQKLMLSHRFSRRRKELDERKSQILSSTSLSVWKVCGRVLTTGLVAVLHKLIISEANVKLRLDYWDAIVENYLRVITLFDAFDSKSSNASLAKIVDDLIVVIYETVDFTKPRIESGVGLAKALFSIGKRRHDSKIQSVLPLVYSLHFFTKLEASTRDQEFVRSTQLMSRYSFVASSLISFGIKQPALLAIVSALAYDSISEAENEPESFDATCAFLFDPISAAKSARTATKSLVNRLISILHHDEILRTSDDTHSLLSISECMKDAATGKGISCILDVEALFAGSFHDTLRRCAPELSDSIRGQQARTVGLLIVTLGDAIKRRSCDGLSTSSLHQILKSLSRLLYRVMKRMNGTEPKVTFALALSHFVAASSLRADNNNVAGDVRSFYWNQLTRAFKALNEFRSVGHMLPIGSLLWLEIVFRRVCLTGACEEISLITCCEQAVHEFLTSKLKLENACQLKIVRCFQMLLSEVQSRFSLSGDYLKAMKAAYWNALLSRRVHGDEKSVKWYTASAVTYLKRADCHGLAATLHGANDAQGDVKGECEQLCGVESRIANLRLQVATNSLDALPKCLTELQCLSSIFNEDKRHRGADSLQMIRRWVESSRLLALAEASTRLHRVGEAVEALRKCVKICQGGAKLSERGSIDDDHTLPLSLSSLQNLYLDRQLECMLHLSEAYDILGDFRKAEAYLIAAGEQAGFEGLAGPRVDLVSLGKSSRSIKSVQQAIWFRSIVSLKSQMHSFQELNINLWAQVEWSDAPIHFSFEHLELQLEQLRALTNVGIASMDSDDRIINNMLTSISYLDMRFSKDFASSLSGLDTLSSDSNTFGIVIARVKLCQAWTLLNVKRAPLEVLEAVKALCTGLVEDLTLPLSVRTLSHFYLGLAHLGATRERGGLKNLWENGEDDLTDHDLQDAREAFEAGLMLVDAHSLPLKRALCRVLALVLGPSKKAAKVGIDAHGLVHASIGITSRAKFLRNLHARGNRKNTKLKELFEADGDDLFGRAKDVLPSAWNVVAIALCPTGELLISGYKDGNQRCCCVFPEESSMNIFDSSIYEHLIMQLDVLIQRSDDHLNGMDESKATDEYSEDSAKRCWWSKRNEFDTRLRQLVYDADRRYFQWQQVRQIFGVASTTYGRCNEEVTPFRGNLASLFDAVSELPLRGEDQSGLMELTVANLKQNLELLGVTFSRKHRKQDLVDLLIRHSRTSSVVLPSKDSVLPEWDNIDCTILVLDENVHRFPFEGLSFLNGKTTTRVPSLQFLLSRLMEPSSIVVDASTVRYVIDPECNLGKTAERITPLIDCANERIGWNWSGVVGEFPTEDFVLESITREHGLFLYCGHGGGKGSFSKTKVDSLVERCDSSTPCRSSIILMGCSSGKLASINRKSVDASERVGIHYEPDGIALSYLLAGAPCVVGNLWDVTDRDIDRYCLEFMDKFLNEDGCSLAKCIAEARSCCKMQHIVGLAPVCYGLPVVRKTC